MNESRLNTARLLCAQQAGASNPRGALASLLREALDDRSVALATLLRLEWVEPVGQYDVFMCPSCHSSGGANGLTHLTHTTTCPLARALRHVQSVSALGLAQPYETDEVFEARVRREAFVEAVRVVGDIGGNTARLIAQALEEYASSVVHVRQSPSTTETVISDVVSFVEEGS